MKTRHWMAGIAVAAALAAIGIGAVSAQPRDDRDAKSKKSDNARVERDDDDFGPCDEDCYFFGGPGPGHGPGAGRGWARGAGGRGGMPGMHGWGRGGGMGGGGLGWGGPGPGGMGMGFGRGAGLLRGGERIAKQIGLTDAQRRKLREIREDHHRLMIKARADMDLARLDLANLMQDDEASSGSIDRQIDVIAGLQADQMKSMAAAHRAALGVLTAKQRDQLSEWTRRGPGSDDDDDARPRRGSRR